MTLTLAIMSVCSPSGGAGTPGPGAAPTTVMVTTSRGEFPLLVYAPLPTATRPSAGASQPVQADVPAAGKIGGSGTPASAPSAGAAPSGSSVTPAATRKSEDSAPGSATSREKPRQDRPGEGAKPLVLLISGEGGWRSFDLLLAQILTEAGYWVGGVDVTKYFREPQDNRRALAADMRAHAEVLARAAARPAGERVLLAGFSFGADLAPWIAGDESWRGLARGLLMIGPDEIGSLEYRLSEILGFQAKDHIFSVTEALDSAKGVPTLFIHGGKDSSSASVLLHGRAAAPKKLIVIPDADHHFSGRTDDLRAALAEGLAWIESGRP